MSERMATDQADNDQLQRTVLQLDARRREMLELMSTLRREQDVYIAIIRWAGKPLEPQ